MPHIPSLPSTALVSNPPIPFQANSVIRGRRTLSPSALAGTLFSPKGRQRKVHCCPADNCGAAFKRSEHLKRHYRAVHVGAKRASSFLSFPFPARHRRRSSTTRHADSATITAFPCQWSSCGKSFSRKDNLQQHVRLPLPSLFVSLTPSHRCQWSTAPPSPVPPPALPTSKRSAPPAPSPNSSRRRSRDTAKGLRRGRRRLRRRRGRTDREGSRGGNR